MATIRKRNGKYQVQVRRLGSKPFSKTFLKLDDAKAWARATEVGVDRLELPTDKRILATTTIGDLLRRYRDEIIVNKRGRDVEAIVANALLRQSWCKIPVAQANGAIFAKYRDQRLKTVKACTIRRELGMIQHTFDIATREWGFPIMINPLKQITKPTGTTKRCRRIEHGELVKLFKATKECRGNQMRPLTLLAIETAMRQGELLSAKWDDIDIEKRLLHIPMSKNGESRTIPLTRRAVRILRHLRSLKTGSQSVFRLSREAVKCAWRRIVKRAVLPDLHFHDLRHEAISRFFERGLSVPEVSLISGHKDVRMLFRYTHMTASHVLAKLG